MAGPTDKQISDFDDAVNGYFNSIGTGETQPFSVPAPLLGGFSDSIPPGKSGYVVLDLEKGRYLMAGNSDETLARRSSAVSSRCRDASSLPALLLTGALLAGALLAACGDDSGSSAGTTSGGTSSPAAGITVVATEYKFAVTGTATGGLRAGDVRERRQGAAHPRAVQAAAGQDVRRRAAAPLGAAARSRAGRGGLRR